jgi:hypothetical protein
MVMIIIGFLGGDQRGFSAPVEASRYKPTPSLLDFLDNL